MSREDPEYYERRAEEQLELAQSSIIPSAVKAHYDLANLYLEKREAAEAKAAMWNALDAPEKSQPIRYLAVVLEAGQEANGGCHAPR
jgi:hypothetical protein